MSHDTPCRAAFGLVAAVLIAAGTWPAQAPAAAPAAASAPQPAEPVPLDAPEPGFQAVSPPQSAVPAPVPAPPPAVEREAPHAGGWYLLALLAAGLAGAYRRARV